LARLRLQHLFFGERVAGNTFPWFDISENGIAAANATAAQFGLADRVEFSLMDLTNTSDLNWQVLAGKMS